MRPGGDVEEERPGQRAEIEAILRDHVRGVHEELEQLFRGVEQALDRHLAGTERAITDALAGYDQRPVDPERRVDDPEKCP
jgi:hypothetical protein